MTMNRRFYHRTLACMAAVAVAGIITQGCAGLGYRLGSTLPEDIKTIHVPTFINDTDEPRLETETTQAAIREFRRDGTLRVVPAGQADTLLTVRLTGLDLKPVRYDEDRVKTTSEYRMNIEALVRFERAEGGEVLLERRLYGDTTFEPRGDLASAKRAAIPDAARDLAHDIVESFVEYW